MEASLAKNIKFVSWVQFMTWKGGQAKLILPLREWLSLPRLWTDSLPYFKEASSRLNSFILNVSELFFFLPCCSGATQYCGWLLLWICYSVCVFKKETTFLIELFWQGEPRVFGCSLKIELFHSVNQNMAFVLLDVFQRMFAFVCCNFF